VREEGTGKEVIRSEVVEKLRMFPSQRMEIGGELRVETLNRGLYRARLYHLAAQLQGSADIPPKLGLDGVHLVDAKALLVMGVADPRGIEDDPEVSINGKALCLKTGTAGALAGQGVHIPLGEVNLDAGGSYEFSLPLNLAGLSHLNIAPTANATRVKLKSAWPHPSFQGRFLPQTRTVGKEGFEAAWQVSHLARDFERTLKAPEGQGAQEAIGISLIDPVNVYLKAERAVKYGILFVVLTFAAFFLTEIMRQLAIHPMQYLLVGLALAIFFLLLIALSEHIDFMLAYAISSAACVALIGIYLAGALGSRLRGVAFGAGIASLYGVLYGVLLSEDNALLMGTMMLFIALGTTMLATRKINWYRVAPLAAEEGQ
jgi:inner membrane protein